MMDDCAQWNSVYDQKDSDLKRCSNPGPLDQQASAYTTELPGLHSLGDGSIYTKILSEGAVFKPQNNL